jgi:hypothetical protein
VSYKPPYLPLELKECFIPGSPDIRGIDSNGGPEHLCLNSGGIFIHWNHNLEATLSVDKQIWDNDGNESVVKLTPKPGDINYICYDQSLTFSKRLLGINNENNIGSVIDMEKDYLSLFKFNGNFFEEISTISTKNKQIEYCTADNKNVVFGISDGNDIFSVDFRTNTIKEYPSYIPGLVVVGCDFRNAKMSDTIRSILALHGGII